MVPTVSATWLLKGTFDLSGQDPKDNLTQRIKRLLCSSLNLPADGLRIRRWPSHPGAWSCLVWWREGDREFAEAQFVAEICGTHPVLSLGIAVEKGVEENELTPEDRMDRSTWHWQRLVDHMFAVLTDDVPAAAENLRSSINFRLRTKIRVRDDHDDAWSERTFSFVENKWFDRHTGRRIEPEEIVAYVGQLDPQKNLWAIAHFARDFGPTEADGMSAEQAASVLIALSRIRRRLST